MDDADFLLALRLQEEWQAEGDEGLAVGPAAPPAVAASKVLSSPRQPLSVVDDAWELLDPSPDVRGLFVQFNETLFWGLLAAVEVKWSPRMTLCAGVCCYEGRGGMCSIRLSEPLLKLRPRKDLVEVSESLQSKICSLLATPFVDLGETKGQTLLHEMIHAFLFVTNNDKDHESHGPEFCKHMDRINRLTGANITIYHDFYNEVDSYRQHWWRCNGPCQNRKPYFGYVKRAMNRAPSANDFWWSEHQKTCGGTFTKIKEPENYSKKGKEKNNQAKVPADDKGRAHGNNIQRIIPFSGKGYVLGGKTSVASSERTTSPINHRRSQHHSPSALTRLNLENEQNISFTNVSPSFSCVGGKNSFPSSLMLPKVSVANNKVYSNVNGSPIKSVLFTGRRSNSSTTNAMSELLPKEKSKKRFFERGTPTPKSHIASHGNYSIQNSGAPKRPRMEDTAAFENYFIKKRHPGWTSPSVESKAEAATVESLNSSVNDQKRKVCCPVCLSEVLEAKINEHLDSCL